MSTSAGPERPDAAPAPGDARTVARVLGAPVDVVGIDEAARRLAHLVDEHRAGGLTTPALIVTLNPEMVMLARRDATFAAILEDAEMRVPDGIGVVRSLRRRGFAQVQRVGGVELMDAYLPVAARDDHRIALAGAAPGVAAAAAARLQERFPGLRVVAAESGDPGAPLAARLQAAAPDVVCAAFGHGRQERFLRDHLAGIGAAAGVGVGGWLDYVSGRVRRAPATLRDAGLEWAWRLALQPWRVRRQAVLPWFWLLDRRETALLARARGSA